MLHYSLNIMSLGFMCEMIFKWIRELKPFLEFSRQNYGIESSAVKRPLSGLIILKVAKTNYRLGFEQSRKQNRF